jgi:hypothetical protein
MLVLVSAVCYIIPISKVYFSYGFIVLVSACNRKISARLLIGRS